jgi:hypothetical protein
MATVRRFATFLLLDILLIKFDFLLNVQVTILCLEVLIGFLTLCNSAFALLLTDSDLIVIFNVVILIMEI